MCALRHQPSCISQRSCIHRYMCYLDELTWYTQRNIFNIILAGSEGSTYQFPITMSVYVVCVRGHLSHHNSHSWLTNGGSIIVRCHFTSPLASIIAYSIDFDWSFSHFALHLFTFCLEHRTLISRYQCYLIIMDICAPFQLFKIQK